MLLVQLLCALPFLAQAATLSVRALRPLPAGAWLEAAALATAASKLLPRADWGHLTLALPLAVSQLLLLVGSAWLISRRIPWSAWRADSNRRLPFRPWPLPWRAFWAW